MEFYYKNDELGDPLITEDHVRLMKLADPHVLGDIKQWASRINALLVPFFQARGMVLVDFKPVPGSKIGESSAHFDIVLGLTPADPVGE